MLPQPEVLALTGNPVESATQLPLSKGAAPEKESTAAPLREQQQQRLAAAAPQQKDSRTEKEVCPTAADEQQHSARGPPLHCRKETTKEHHTGSLPRPPWYGSREGAPHTRGGIKSHQISSTHAHGRRLSFFLSPTLVSHSSSSER